MDENIERRPAMNTDPNRVKAIFLEAVERYAPDQWPSFLDEACAGQPDLRRRVELLLKAHREAGTGQEAASDISPSIATSAETPGLDGPATVIGPYKLLQQIGEGGMGT